MGTERVLLNPEGDTLADLVPDEIHQIQGITAPDALIGVRGPSGHDSEKMVSIGMD